MRALVPITVRYFAAARAAAATDSEELALAPGVTVAQLVAELRGRNDGLARVLARCSYLCDGVAVRDLSAPLSPGSTIDVLPPFAGG